jgi:CBS domain-containing protein
VLTEKVVRKGTHLTREYSIDPLEVFLVSEIMPRAFMCFRSGTSLEAAVNEATGAWSAVARRRLAHVQRLYPVLDDDGRLLGLVTRHQLHVASLRAPGGACIDDVMDREPVVGHPDMTLRELANLMAAREVSSVPIVDRHDPGQLLSVIALDHVLEARLRDVNEEHHLERVLSMPRLRPLGGGRVLARGRGAEHTDRDAPP